MVRSETGVPCQWFSVAHKKHKKIFDRDFCEKVNELPMNNPLLLKNASLTRVASEKAYPDHNVYGNYRRCTLLFILLFCKKKTVFFSLSFLCICIVMFLFFGLRGQMTGDHNRKEVRERKLRFGRPDSNKINDLL